MNATDWVFVSSGNGPRSSLDVLAAYRREYAVR
jgi:hypothetical protein